jgi:hypothetical protein
MYAADLKTITRRVSIQIVPVATTTVLGGGGELQDGNGNGAMGRQVDNKLLMTVLAVPLFGLLTGLMGMFI